MIYSKLQVIPIQLCETVTVSIVDLAQYLPVNADPGMKKLGYIASYVNRGAKKLCERALDQRRVLSIGVVRALSVNDYTVTLYCHLILERFGAFFNNWIAKINSRIDMC
ncbi:hypothetical protein [Agarilytica rhodophyticola]|uniref:hypothetical protein n=1 Tax=Agarilytica rhodophyticola TaxID=1737490 RepID=UPI000B341323|nr:hypothetical protein [Agarilytica rhodophyticola]